MPPATPDPAAVLRSRSYVGLAVTPLVIVAVEAAYVASARLTPAPPPPPTAAPAAEEPVQAPRAPAQ